METTSAKIGSAPKDIQEQFGSFIENAMSECEELQKGIADIRDLSRQFADYFCEDQKKFVLEDYLKVILEGERSHPHEFQIPNTG